MVDSGATHHVTCDASALFDVRDPPTVFSSIKTATARAPVTAMGTLQLRTGGKLHLLTDVLLVPNSSVNIFSALRSTSADGRIISLDKKGATLTHNRQPILRAHRSVHGLCTFTAQVLRSHKSPSVALARPEVEPAVTAAAAVMAEQRGQVHSAGSGQFDQGYASARLEANLQAHSRLEPAVSPLKGEASTAGGGAARHSKEACVSALHVISGPQSARTWHRRLGHLGMRAMQQLSAASGMSMGYSNEDAVAAVRECEVCALTKQSTSPYNPDQRTSSRPLELVHTDVCGPFATTTPSGGRYVVTLLDDYTRYSTCRVLRAKSETAQFLQDTILLWENQQQQKVQRVRSDRGMEYMSGTLQQWFKGKGIQHDTSAPYTPQQNGAAERLNRTLPEKVRPMMLDAGLEECWWGETFVTACHLSNLAPTPHHSETPYKLWHKQHPDHLHLRSFGCRAYVMLPSTQRPGKQLGPTAMKDADSDSSFEPAPTPAPTPVRSSQRLAARAPAPAAAAEAPADLPRRSSRVAAQQAAGGSSALLSSAAACVAKAAAAEPATYTATMKSAERGQWQAAMNDELDSMQQHNVWDLLPTPPGVKPLPLRWVLKWKHMADGSSKAKARLCAKGYSQREGVDYEEIFAPVSKHTTVRTLLAKVAAENLELHQLDIKPAFLHGELEEEVWVQQPEGFAAAGARSTHSCRLNKSLYGLKQAPRAWHKKLHSVLQGEMGYTACSSDPGLYVQHSEQHGSTYIIVYVDDLLVAARSMERINAAKQAVAAHFDTRDLGEPKCFIGLEISRDRTARTLAIRQQQLISEVIQKYGQGSAAGREVPMALGTQLYADGQQLQSGVPYAALVGSLMYLSQCTRPDLAYSAGLLARLMAQPTEEAWTAAKGVVKYLRATPDVGIVFGATADAKVLHTVGYTDADYAGDVNNRRITSAYVFILYGGAISWSSKQQRTVATSTAEAEYMAAAACVKEAVWLRGLLCDLNVCDVSDAQLLYTDNQAALSLLKNPQVSGRAKHIAIHYHFARERVQMNEVVFEYISTSEMVADALTKALPNLKLEKFRQAVGLMPF